MMKFSNDIFPNTCISKMIKKLNDDEMSVLKLRNAIEECKTGKYTSIIQKDHYAKDHNVKHIMM